MTGPGPWRGAEQWSREAWRTHLPGAADPGLHAERLATATIPALAAEAASRVPDRVAVCVDGAPITHGQLDAAAAAAAGWLSERMAPGDRLLLAAGSSLEFLIAYLGALRAGVIVVLANPAYTATELAHLVADSGAALALADDAPARQLGSVADGPPVVPIGGQPLAGRRPLRSIRPGPGDVALIAYTSGTTGRPKGAPLTHGQLAVSIRAAMAAWRWSDADILLHALPLFHQHGLGGVHTALIAGSTTHVHRKFAAADLIAAAQDCGASVLFGVPTMYRALLASQQQGARPALARLRLAVCGSAPLSPALGDQLPGVLGKPAIVRYGTSETGLDISNPCAQSRTDTIGIPLPGVLARVWASSDEAVPGTDGEIQLRGPQVFGGYWRDRAATAAAFTGDGWFRTGDIAAVDPDSGHLIIRGRSTDLIVSGGMNVYPREVELALESHAAVAEAAVAGLPSERWGEQVTGWVVTRPGHRFDEAELVAHARTRLAPYKCPKQIIETAELPRNAMGKLNRAALAASPERGDPASG
jgi:acyl-CoA synthetase (AMP-forming)/AMP-acid ligase II